MVSTENNPVIGEIIFSLSDDRVWVSWPRKGASVELGHCETVTFMMRDFLAQCDLAQQLANRLRTEK
jgi:hypothetical protein